MLNSLSPLKIGQHTARYPIVQGAMAVRVSGGHLAGAVAKTGGIGTVATLGLGLNSPYFDHHAPRRRKYPFSIANRLALVDELQKARAVSSDGIIAVNVLVATKNYADLVQTAAEHGANLIVAGGGLPLTLPEYTANYPDVALVPIVSTVADATSICQHWERHYVIVPTPLGIPGRALYNKFAQTAIADRSLKAAPLTQPHVAISQSSSLDQRCVANCLQACTG